MLVFYRYYYVLVDFWLFLCFDWRRRINTIVPAPTRTSTSKVALNASNQVSWNIDNIALSVAGSVLKQQEIFIVLGLPTFSRTMILCYDIKILHFTVK